MYKKEHIFINKIKGAAAHTVIGNLTQSKQRDINLGVAIMGCRQSKSFVEGVE